MSQNWTHKIDTLLMMAKSDPPICKIHEKLREKLNISYDIGTSPWTKSRQRSKHHTLIQSNTNYSITIRIRINLN